nr:putative ribonuclease H-like domain-containing protein [Tanacetum cinerariifolium]
TNDTASQEVKKDVSFLRYIALPNWAHDALLEFSSSKPQDHCSTEVPEGSGNTNPTASTSNPLPDHIETLTVESPITTISSPVPTTYSIDSQDSSSDARLISKRVDNQEETPSLDNILSLTNRFKDILGGTTNSNESNGVEADVSNLETTITASPNPTLRIHKDHPKSQIIGPVDTSIQTKNKSKEDPDNPAKVYKVEKAMNGLHQAPRAWYGTLSKYLLKNGFQKGTIDQTLFIRRQRGDFILVQVYVDDIIFGSSNPQLCREFKALMHEKFQMSAMGELNFFFGCKSYRRRMAFFSLKKSIEFEALMHEKFQMSDMGELNFFLGLDYGGATQDRKSTTGGCQFLGRRLISWQCKKQTIVATSTTEAEYVAAASCCGQVLWIQNQLLDYGLSMTCETLSREISTSILHLVGLLLIIEDSFLPLGIFPTVRPNFPPARRNLKLQDEDGISSLPDTKLFENLSLMGYNISQNQKFTFQKGQFSHQWKYLIHTIMQCLSPKSTGFNEFSSNIATALVCHATNGTYHFLKMIFDGLVKNINNKGAGSGTPTEPHHTPSPHAPPSSHTHISSPSLPTVTPISTAPILTVTPSETTPLRQYFRRARIAQSFTLPPVADEPASPVRDVSQGEACPTESGFIADQDRTTIAKSSTLPHDSATRVTSPAAAQEVEINKLKERVKLLEDGKGMAAEGSEDDAPIKKRRLDEEEVATERVSSDTEEIRLDEREVAAEKVNDDTEELATVLITMDAASVLSSGGVQVVLTAAAVAPANVSISTGSRVVPTASTTISTATPIFATATTVTPYISRKGKEKMVETHTPKKKKRVQEQIDIQDEEIAKIHAEEELQQMIADHHSKILKYQAQQRKSRTKKQKRDFYMAVIRNNLGWKVKDFKGMSFEEVEAKFKTVWEQIEGGVSKISEREVAWLKRKGIRSEQESAKKQKNNKGGTHRGTKKLLEDYKIGRQLSKLPILCGHVETDR